MQVLFPAAVNVLVPVHWFLATKKEEEEEEEEEEGK